MEEKKYPTIEEEEGIGMCCEPEAGYAATGSGYANTLAEEDKMISDDFDPGDHGDGSLIINFPEIHIESREIFCAYDRNQVPVIKR